MEGFGARFRRRVADPELPVALHPEYALVLPVFSAPTAAVHADLILRFDPDGEMFAVLDCRRIERPL
jgi:hypothetical protein